jgi:hypothetical protein
VAKDRIDTANPKFRGAFSGQQGVASGMNVGGLTDAQVRINAWGQGKMLHDQLAKDKSASNPVP